jgi:hypothetical protein
VVASSVRSTVVECADVGRKTHRDSAWAGAAGVLATAVSAAVCLYLQMGGGEGVSGLMGRADGSCMAGA